jgi:hypothetical protein
MGRMFIILGLVFLVVGILLTFGGRLPLRIGRLPGDLVFRGKNSVFYFPLATSLLLSLALSLLLWIFRR